MPPKHSPKRQGEWAEVRFLEQCFRRQLNVSKPFGDNTQYDFITDSAGFLRRVQVKSVSRLSGSSYRVTLGRGGGRKRGYSLRDADLLAAYVFPCDTWYLIPIAAVAGKKSIRLLPLHAASGKYEGFRNSWSLLRPNRQSGTRR